MSHMGTYRSEDVTATFTCNMVKDSYGVPGSPVWDTPVDIELNSVTILDVEVNIDALPDDLQNAINSLSEHIDDWEIQ